MVIKTKTKRLLIAIAIVLFAVRPLNFFLVVFKPLVAVINYLSNGVLRLIGLHPYA